jgi:hypothetical protein
MYENKWSRQNVIYDSGRIMFLRGVLIERNVEK